MTSREYTVASFLYAGLIFGFACIMQWASFMQPFRDWCNDNDTATGLIMIALILPLGFLFHGGMKAYQYERSKGWDQN